MTKEKEKRHKQNRERLDQLEALTNEHANPSKRLAIFWPKWTGWIRIMKRKKPDGREYYYIEEEKYWALYGSYWTKVRRVVSDGQEYPIHDWRFRHYDTLKKFVYMRYIEDKEFHIDTINTRDESMVIGRMERNKIKRGCRQHQPTSDRNNLDDLVLNISVQDTPSDYPMPLEDYLEFNAITLEEFDERLKDGEVQIYSITNLI